MSPTSGVRFVRDPDGPTAGVTTLGWIGLLPGMLPVIVAPMAGGTTMPDLVVVAAAEAGV